MRREARETALTDYFRSIRRGWILVVITTLVCAGVALGASLVQRRSYQAQASVNVQDPNSALALAGTGVLSSQTPLQIASTYAAQVTRQEVVQGVDKDLPSRLSGDSLRRSVSVSVDPNSALVDILATANTAVEAAAIANGFARLDASLTTAETRHQYAVEAAQLSKKLLHGPGTRNPGAQVIDLSQLARLQTLSSVATPVQVNTSARVPSGASSPLPARNTLAAGIFGLLLGILLAYGRDTLDRRLRDPAAVEEVLDHPVIGAIRAEAFGSTGAHTDAASNGLVPLSAADQEAFQVLRQNIRYFAASPLRTVVVTSAVAEEGKSTVAACLATAAAVAGQQTVLVECDLRRSVLASRLGLPRAPGLTDYLTGNATPSEIVRSVPTIQPSSDGDPDGLITKSGVDGQKLSCITAGTLVPRPTELLASDRFRNFLEEIAEVYATVILDSAPLLTVADTHEIIPDIAGVLVCVRLRQTTRDQARAVQAALARLPERPVGVIVTGVRDAEDGYYGYYGSYTAPASATP